MQRRTLMNLMALGVLLAKAPFAAAEGDDSVVIVKIINRLCNCLVITGKEGFKHLRGFF